jgi:hypothetical protein
MIFETIGWIGTISYLAAYLLLSLHYFKAQHTVYQLMNVLGGICLSANALRLNDGPGFVTNFAWMGIGLFATIQILRNRFKAGNPQ